MGSDETLTSSDLASPRLPTLGSIAVAESLSSIVPNGRNRATLDNWISQADGEDTKAKPKVPQRVLAMIEATKLKKAEKNNRKA